MSTKKMTATGVMGVYGTNSEILYIDKLGEHQGPGESKSKCRFSHLEMLKKYYVNAQRRVDWGTIDKHQAISFCLGKIAKEEKKGI